LENSFLLFAQWKIIQFQKYDQRKGHCEFLPNAISRIPYIPKKSKCRLSWDNLTKKFKRFQIIKIRKKFQNQENVSGESLFGKNLKHQEKKWNFSWDIILSLMSPE